MGNGTSRVVGCFVPFNAKNGVDLEFLEPLDEGLGHSFCYVRPSIFESPAITPSTSERFTVDSSTLDSETLSGSFRHDTCLALEDPSGLHKSNNNNKCFPETTFKAISGASVSANVSTARTGNQSALIASDVQEPAASFESTSSFAAIPLQPAPHGSGPLNGFMSGPLERGFASGPLDRGGGFMSGPIEKGVMSGPIDSADKSNFSEPLARCRQRPGLQRLMRSVSGPMKSTLSRTFSRHPLGSGWMQRLFLHPMTQLSWHPKEQKSRPEFYGKNLEGGPSEGEYRNTHNLQWAHGKAGEDRVHVVLSEEQGWLFIGIYDGFSGPDAPDFLMSYLYRAIDKELEGLLWDYEDKPPGNSLKPVPHRTENPETISGCSWEDQPNIHSTEVISCSLTESCNPEIFGCLQTSSEIVAEKNEVRMNFEQQLPNCINSSISGTSSVCVPTANITGQGRKSKRLYELFQMEPWDEPGYLPALGVGKQRKDPWVCQRNLDSLASGETSQLDQIQPSSLHLKGDSTSYLGEDPTTSGEGRGVGIENSCPGVQTSVLGQRQNTGKVFIVSKIKKMYRKQKSLRKKLFPWNYDWHREDNCLDVKMAEQMGPIRRCKSGIVDHDAVLRAMARALERTEDAYMEMVENALDKNPELALMGSCVLVMLMKDQDVYVMNLGDSRAVLAQERPNDRHPNQNFVKDDVRHGNRSRESLVRMELDRISEESPIHNQNSRVNMINKNREISMCRLKMRAVQLSSDHSTNIEEVCFHY